jgi:hypothetical protein
MDADYRLATVEERHQAHVARWLLRAEFKAALHRHDIRIDPEIEFQRKGFARWSDDGGPTPRRER